MDELEDLPFGEEFEIATIQLAMKGDAQAGAEALRICATGLYGNNLSERMRFYLAQCLIDLASGIKAERAMNLETLAGPGGPKNPFPDWEVPLAVLASILKRRGVIKARIEEAMSDARKLTQDKYLDPKEARRIWKKYAPMDQVAEEDLLHISGAAEMRRFIIKFFPVT